MRDGNILCIQILLMESQVLLQFRMQRYFFLIAYIMKGIFAIEEDDHAFWIVHTLPQLGRCFIFCNILDFENWSASDVEKARSQTAMCVNLQDYLPPLTILQNLQVQSIFYFFPYLFF